MSAFADLSALEQEELVVSLSALVCADCGVETTEETMAAVIAASGNKVGPQWAPVFAATIKKVGGVDAFCPEPGSGNRELFVRDREGEFGWGRGQLFSQQAVQGVRLGSTSNESYGWETDCQQTFGHAPTTSLSTWPQAAAAAAAAAAVVAAMETQLR